MLHRNLDYLGTMEPLSELPMAACARTRSPLNAIGILREAIKIPARNKAAMFHILLLIVSPFSLIVLLHCLIAVPIIQKVEDGFENSALDQEDVRALVGTELAFFAAFWIVSFYGMMLTVYASSTIYAGSYKGLKELMLWIRLSWKKSLITWLHVSFLTFAYAILVMVMVKLVNLIAHSDTSAWGWVVGILAAPFCLFRASSWILALVVSVLEDGIRGAAAVGRAHELIRGKQLQGFSLLIVLLLLGAPIYILFYVTATDDDDELGPFIQFAFGSVATVLFCIAKFFIFVTFAVFHHECKESHGENVEMDVGYEDSSVSW